MAQRTPNRSPAGWSGLGKNLALWALLALVAMSMWQYMAKQRSVTTELSYTEFSRQLDAGNVVSVEVFDGRTVKGEFKSPVSMGNVSAKDFTVLLPVANSEALLERLEKSGVAITAREPKGGLTTLLLAAQAPQALARGVEISFEMKSHEAWIEGDAQLLHEMLANLLDNALRYGATRVTLTALGSECGVVWQVTDNGPGIPEAQREAVFAPFHRMSGRVEGAGLGLTIVQRIAHLHGATVRLEAGEDGRGLRADVEFPVLPA